MLREFVETEVDPQALEYNRLEKFNINLFKKLGTLGVLGILFLKNMQQYSVLLVDCRF